MDTMKSVLTIAGSDSSGGAGIQADIKTIQAHKLFATTAITAITVQNTCGVSAVEDIAPEVVAGQINAVFEDIPPSAIKIGMVSVVPTIKAIAESLKANKATNVVLDPVMVATSGSRLLADDAADAIVSELFPLALVITPNIPEAEVLAGMAINCQDDMVQAARVIADKSSLASCEAKNDAFCSANSYNKLAVLIKGGHQLENHGSSADFLLDNNGQEIWLDSPRIDNPNTHGTGCTLSSAIACGLASGLSLAEACSQAKAYITGALEYGLDLGKCSGPLNHMWQYMTK